MKLILLILTYPLVFCVALWNGVGEYIGIVVNHRCSLKGYKYGLIYGFEEFIQTHERIYTKLLNED